MDREKVIEGLENLRETIRTATQYTFTSGGICAMSMKRINNAIELLKEQEAVKPRVSSVEQRCGNCNKVIEMDGWIACPWCGKPILWEAVGRTVKRE